MEKEIFFHVGLGKVASTYLQQEVFPKLKGIHYLHTSKYKRSKNILPKLDSPKVLVSREFDRQFEKEVRWFTKTYPEARIIILFRKHDSWIASQYRRHVKNGFQGSFQSFFDSIGDTGFWKKKDLLFYPKLRIIEECCQHKPLVLFHDQLKSDPWEFISQIAHYTGASFDKNEISLDAVHKSYSEKQLKAVQSFCRRFLNKPPKSYQNKIKHWLFYRPWWAFFHLIMYAALLFPDNWVSQTPLVSEEERQRIKNEFQEDWDKISEYARENNPLREQLIQ